MNQTTFGVSITIHEQTGDLISAYFQIRRGKVHTTVEFADGAAFADYNKHGQLLGIEVLSTCSVSIVNQIAANESPELRQQTMRFMRNAGPREMIAA